MPENVGWDSHSESSENGLVLLSSAAEPGRVYLYLEKMDYECRRYPMNSEGTSRLSTKYARQVPGILKKVGSHFATLYFITEDEITITLLHGRVTPQTHYVSGVGK